MRDAIGGVLTIQIIVIFLILINGYLAFNVNYTRAFRVKNQIISIIEQNEGFDGDYKSVHSKTRNEIGEYLKDIGYNTESIGNKKCATIKASTAVGTANDDTGHASMPGGYCLKAIHTSTDGTFDASYRGTYYSVITFVNIEIPIMNMIFPNGVTFQVKGETRLIYSSGT